MFTGLVETTGTVVSLEPIADGARLAIRAPAIANELAIGESLAVNGCCLTVNAEPHDDAITFDLLAQTLHVTNLGELRENDSVNLERALRADSRLGGHFVQGHVDAIGRIVEYAKKGQDHILIVSVPREFMNFLIPKGSIAIDGISLTTAEVDDDSANVTCWITPHTHAETNLTNQAPEKTANLEFDILAKYIGRLTASRVSSL
ncbi:MAG: riboflavin synthase [Verrucomicrobiota bacterium]